MVILYSLFFLLTGLVVGSFLNVVIYRSTIPGGSIFKPSRSFCPECKKPITWYDNIPVLSFFILKGKCRNCGKKIPAIYPIIEALTAGIFLLNYLFFSDIFISIGISIISASLISAAVIDIKTLTVHDANSIFVLLGGIIISLAKGNLPLNLITAGITLLFLLAFHFLSKMIKKEEAFGMGDVLLISASAVALGPLGTIFGVMLSSILGIIFALYTMKKSGIKKIPFLPPLAAGIYISLLFAEKIFSEIEKIFY